MPKTRLDLILSSSNKLLSQKRQNLKNQRLKALFGLVPSDFLRLTCLLAVPLLAGIQVSQAKYLQVRTNRWLEVQQMTGTVTYEKEDISELAKIGTRLQTVGEAIQTGVRSSAVLAVDTNIGVVNVSENTRVRIQELQVRPNGGRVTKLQITGGQVRLQVRPFTNPGSQLQIETPAGVSAVRGTQFGIIVHPDGRTGVATSEGSVVTQAQGKEVVVDAGFQSVMIPGEPPSPAIPLKQDSGLKLLLLTRVGNTRARIIGQVDPINLAIVEKRTLVTDRSGKFDITLTLPSNRRIEAVVKTPLGKQQVYELAVP